MSEPTLKAQYEKGRDQLRTMRDEIRVKLHLAGMEAEDRWRKLEPEIERAITEAEHTTERVIDGVVSKLQKFSDSLG